MSGIYGYWLIEESDTDFLSPMKKWHLMYGKDASDEIKLGRVGLGCALFHIPENVPIDTPCGASN